MATTEEIRAAVHRVKRHEAGNDVYGSNAEHLSIDRTVICDAYFNLINRTPAEAAKAAADEVNDICVSNGGVPCDYAELLSIIQCHTPPVNERLFDALADLTDMLTNPLRDGFALVNPESLLPVQEARKAIAEARAVLEEK